MFPVPTPRRGAGNAPRERASERPRQGREAGSLDSARGAVSLRDALSQLPDDALVPVQWVRRHLDAEQTEAAGREVLLTVRQVAERYERSKSTVRGWCASGELSGAFKLHRTAWRIPESALEHFDVRQQLGSRRCALGQAESTDLAKWRHGRCP